MQITINYTLFLVKTALLVLAAIGLNSILRSHGLANTIKKMQALLFSSFLRSTAIQTINISSSITDIIPNIWFNSQNFKTRFL